MKRPRTASGSRAVKRMVHLSAAPWLSARRGESPSVETDLAAPEDTRAATFSLENTDRRRALLEPKSSERLELV